MKVFRTISDYRAWKSSIPSNSTLGFVPTMGFLHRGHISLIDASKLSNHFTACSIFVNPIQFNNQEDLKNYPRNEAGDLEMLEKAGCDAVFIPTYEEMYPAPVTKKYDFPGIDNVMEGALRPGHFNGVAIVVSRLFDIIGPNISYFGKKDYQQYMIIKELARQEFPDMIIQGMPIVREADGLAMSSRNARLNPEEREMAPLISEVLQRSRQLVEEFSPEEVCRHCERMLSESGMLKPEYFIIADAITLKPIQHYDSKTRAVAFVAAWLGKVRLIDNLELF